MRKVMHAARMLLVAALLLAALGWVSDALAGEKRGGTLTIVRPTDPVSLDSNLETTGPGAWVYYNITEPLLVLDEAGKLQPRLATSWQQLSPTKVRFKLRPSVKFHDGTPFNAAAVKFTIDRAFNEKPGARWASLAGPFAGAEVVDDLTVDISTKEPYGPTLRSLAMAYVGIVSPTAVKKHGENYGRNPVGTGPFKFVEWRTNTSITIEKNNDYWGDKALVDRVVFKVVPEEGARMISLRTGEADMVLIPSPADLPNLKREGKFNVYEVVGGRIIFVGFNLAKPIVNDPLVRQAMFHAVNINSILDNIYEGSAVRPKSYLAPSVFGFKDMQFDKLYPYDKAKAKALFAKAGWTPGADGILQKGGQKMTLSWLASRGRYLKDAEMAEAAQAQLKEVGVDARLQFLEWGAVFSQMRSANLDPHVHLWLDHHQQRCRLHHALLLPVQERAAGRLEPGTVLRPEGGCADREGAKQRGPAGAREDVRRGPDHHGEGADLDPGGQHQGSRRHAALRPRLFGAPGRVQSGPDQGLVG
jgi:peptide/nickel transport system substrate-binding protein